MTSWAVVVVGGLSIVAWNLPFAFCFFAQMPFFDQYLIQPKKRGSKTAGTWFYALGVNVVHYLLAVALQVASTGTIAWLVVRPDFYDQTTLWHHPPHHLYIWVRDMVLALFVEDTIFYFIHYSLHHPWLYATFHKVHHEYKAPFHFSAVYATTTEFVVSDLGPLIVACLCCSHLATALAFLSLRLYITTEIHSGYSFPWSVDNMMDAVGIHFLSGAKHHDEHHQKSNVNFSSTLYFWDWLLSTSSYSTIKSQAQSKSMPPPPPPPAPSSGAESPSRLA